MSSAPGAAAGRRPYRTGCLAIAASALLPGLAFGASPTRRTDLSEAFRARLCESGGGIGLGAAETLGVFDAQIEGRRLQNPDGQAVDALRAEGAARSLAKVHGALGYAYGLCADGTAWAISVPAPEPLRVVAGRLPEWPTKALAAACAEVRVDFAPDGLKAPRSLPLERDWSLARGAADLVAKEPGLLAVTCRPRMPAWRGDILWYLAPTGNRSDGGASLPEAGGLSDQATDGVSAAKDLAAWVNRVRSQMKLSSLGHVHELTIQADHLLADASLAHDRALLQRIAAKIAPSGLALLGEDRVKGVSPRAMAELWWASPRHRGLILAADANLMAVAVRPLGQESLAVLLTAKGQRPLASSHPSGKAPPL